MIIAGKVNCCDFTDTSYDSYVDGGYVLARGATNRVCCVMFVGPEFIKERGMKISSYEEAVAWAESEPGGYLDV